MNPSLFEHSLLIGFGALGKALYSMLSSRGIFFSHIVYPSASGQSDGISHFSSDFPENEAFHPSFIFICVPDDEISDVVSKIYARFPDLNQTRIAHTSGALDRSLLKPLEEKGALTATWHPMMTFNRQQQYRSLNGTIVSIDAESPFYEELAELTTILEGHPIHIPSTLKPAYHLLGVFGSNFLLALLNILHSLIKDLNQGEHSDKIELRHLMPIVLQTLNNYLEHPSIETLSGPVKRKDFITIAQHIAFLAKYHPDLIPVYKEISQYLAVQCNYDDNELKKFHQIFREQNGSEK